MKCKYCGEEMAEELITCPSCGKAQTSAEDISAEIQEVLAIKKAIEEAKGQVNDDMTVLVAGIWTKHS